jgi:hypothetical protein
MEDEGSVKPEPETDRYLLFEYLPSRRSYLINRLYQLFETRVFEKDGTKVVCDVGSFEVSWTIYFYFNQLQRS